MADPFDYDGMAADALELLTDFGQAMLVRRTTNSGTVYAPTQTTADHATVGVVTEYPRWYPAYTEGGATDVLRTDRLGIIAPPDIVPTPFDVLVIADGTVFRVIDVKPVYPGGKVLAYKLQLRI